MTEPEVVLEAMRAYVELKLIVQVQQEKWISVKQEKEQYYLKNITENAMAQQVKELSSKSKVGSLIPNLAKLICP